MIKDNKIIDGGEEIPIEIVTDVKVVIANNKFVYTEDWWNKNE